jgi:KDO2-lipid IV(A) lauroyltransferase
LEIETLCQEYYRYLCDIIVETFKQLTMSASQISERCKFMNPEMFGEYKKKNQNIVILMGHYGNWEWGGSAFSLLNHHQLRVVYRPLSDPNFDRLLLKTRTKFGTKLIKVKETLKDIIQYKGELSAFAFIADQTSDPRMAVWTNFLNQETDFSNGAAKIAIKFDYPVVFINITKKKRGYYQVWGEQLVEKPKEHSEQEIIKKFASRLEQQIHHNPSLWLWSHNRWKYQRTNYQQ